MITVLIIDDQAVFRAGAKVLLEASADIRVKAEAASRAEALEAQKSCRPSVTMVSLDLDEGEGLWIVSALKNGSPDTRILGLGRKTDGPTVLRALQSGATGYYSKQEDSAALATAVRWTAENRRYLSLEAREHLLDDVFAEQLTAREVQILSAVANGNSNKSIAFELGIAEGTVKSHIHQVLKKLGAADRTGAVTRALQMGLITVPPRPRPVVARAAAPALRLNFSGPR